MTTSRLLKYPEAADYLRVSLAWLYDAVAANKIAVVRLGRSVRFSREALDEFIARSTVPAAVAVRRVGRPSLAERRRSAYRSSGAA